MGRLERKERNREEFKVVGNGAMSTWEGGGESWCLRPTGFPATMKPNPPEKCNEEQLKISEREARAGLRSMRRTKNEKVKTVQKGDKCLEGD